MGLLRKIKFWSKSTKTSAIESLEAPTEDELVMEGTTQNSDAGALFSVESGVAARTVVGQFPEDSEDEDLPPTEPISPVSPEGELQDVSPPTVKLPINSSPKLSTRPSLLATVPEGQASSDTESVAATPQWQQQKAKDVDVPEVKREDLIGFNEPLGQVYAGVKEAFGSMIASSVQSSKWEKRAEALKAISIMMQGLVDSQNKKDRVRDPTKCWRLSCQLLNQCLRDKVMPVRLAALGLFTDTFSRTEGLAPRDHVQFALDVLFECLIDKLGDTNVRLHESIQKCVLLTAENESLFGLDGVLSRLRKRFSATAGRSGERMNFGILDTASFLLQHFPGRRGCKHDDDDEIGTSRKDSWTQHDIKPFILAGMDDSQGARVRTSAVSLAVAVYQTFGMNAMSPVLAGLRPAKQQVLKQAFAECEEYDEDGEDEGGDEDGETWTADLGGLVIQGNAIKPCVYRPSLPGTIDTRIEEESLMDGILEETGMVFKGTGIMTEGKLGYSSNSMMDLDLDELEFSFNHMHDNDVSLRSDSIEVC